MMTLPSKPLGVPKIALIGKAVFKRVLDRLPHGDQESPPALKVADFQLLETSVAPLGARL